MNSNIFVRHYVGELVDMLSLNWNVSSCFSQSSCCLSRSEYLSRTNVLLDVSFRHLVIRLWSVGLVEEYNVFVPSFLLLNRPQTLPSRASKLPLLSGLSDKIGGRPSSWFIFNFNLRCLRGRSETLLINLWWFPTCWQAALSFPLPPSASKQPKHDDAELLRKSEEGW